MKRTLTFADVQRVKHLAKQLKATAPELPHTKRLDLAAAELCGARNFHELNRWFDVVINQHVDTPDGSNSVSHCLYCDYRFAADLKLDQKLHRDFHERVMEAEEKLKYRPGTFVERELMKKDGYDEVSHGKEVADRVEGLLKVTRGWFDRSLHRAIDSGYWKKHPSFEAYVAMMVPELEILHSSLTPILVDRYGRTPGVIQEGEVCWSPL